MTALRPFPAVRARDLEGLDVDLPDAFAGARNLVAVAFRREQQREVDSWVPWFEREATTDPGLRFYEVPTIGRWWAPFRPLIDGGMAAAIRDPVVLRRTLTVYGDVGRVTRPLDITDRSRITVCLVDGSGGVRWQGVGGCTAETAAALDAVLTTMRDADG